MPSKINDIVLSARDGEPSAQEQLFERYRPYLKLLSGRLAPTFLRKRCDASDIVQQTCVDALKAITGFRGKTEAEFTAWIATILRSNIVDACRQHTAEMRDLRKEVQLHEANGTASLNWHILAQSGSSPSVRAVRGESALVLADALDQLREDMALAVTLRYIEGMKLAEVAKEMDTTVATAAGLVRRGLKQLNQILPKNFLGEND